MPVDLVTSKVTVDRVHCRTQARRQGVTHNTSTGVSGRGPGRVMYLHGPVQADAALDARQAAAVLLILGPGLLGTVLQVLLGRCLAEAALPLPAAAGRLTARVLQGLNPQTKTSVTSRVVIRTTQGRVAKSTHE